MCGIAAIFAYRNSAPKMNRDELRTIRDHMAARGPDGTGEWFSGDGRVGLGHRRLAIIDLSTKAAQPMANSDHSRVISFNGEIYNYKELKSNLEKKGIIFQSQSDTEVLLHLYAERGTEMLRELRGMFAFILWDEKKKTLFLVRDPYGIKPLYYADDTGTLRAASQVKALLAGGEVSHDKDPAGVVGFFLTGSVPEPFTFYREIKQVPAGSFISVDANGIRPPEAYASIPGIFHEACHEANGRAASETEEDRRLIHDALTDSLKHHFVSDVPVGIFLSSGIDSSALVGLASEAGSGELRTLTLAFDEFKDREDDEAPIAEQTASLYSTRHTTRRLSQSEFQSELDRALQAMDQPSIDGINTYFVSKIARECGLKVCLSGLGGDELFGGYPSFQDIPRMVKTFSIPSRIPFLGDLFAHLYASTAALHTPLPPKAAGLIKYGGSYAGAYFIRRGLFMPWELESVLDADTARAGLKQFDLVSHFETAYQQEPRNSFARVAALESSFYLRNQLLRDADWAGMAHALEIRVPYVDVVLLKKIASVLMNQNHSNGNKGLLKQSLNRALPEIVLNRKKTGFTVPIHQWLESDSDLDMWKKVPLLSKANCHWSRRWAYTVYNVTESLQNHPSPCPLPSGERVGVRGKSPGPQPFCKS